ncbi:nuclear receptor co-repressor 1 [Aphanomyces cochlioides]|nr:nuclear receptor co-repressor 1 [Aphanomyces cochlioides]
MSSSNTNTGNTSPHTSNDAVAGSYQDDRQSSQSGSGGRPYQNYRGPQRNISGNSNFYDRSRSRFDKEPPYAPYNSGRGGGPNRGRGGFYPYNKSRPMSRPYGRDRSRSRSRSRSKDKERRDHFLDSRDRNRDRSRDRSRDRRHQEPQRDSDSSRSDVNTSSKTQRQNETNQDVFNRSSPVRHPSESTHESPRPAATTSPILSGKSSPRPGLLESPKPESKAATHLSPMQARQSSSASNSPIRHSKKVENVPMQSSPRKIPIDSASTYSSPRLSNRLPAYSSPRQSSNMPNVSKFQSPIRNESSQLSSTTQPAPNSPRPASAMQHANPTTPERFDTKRDELSPLKPFLSRRGSIDHLVRTSSPRQTMTSPSTRSPHRRRPSEGDEKQVRRKSIDEVTKPEVTPLEEPLLEPPKPKETVEETNGTKQRARLGWGQGLAASPSSNAETSSNSTKRPRMGWGMGLVVTQVPSPKVQNESTVKEAAVDPNEVHDTDLTGSASNVTQIQQPLDASDAPATEQPPRSPEDVDMDIDSIDSPSEEDQRVAANALIESEGTGIQNIDEQPQKEDILAAIDALDAEIADTKQRLATANEQYQLQLEQPPPPITEESVEAEQTCSPVKKSRPVLVDPELMMTVQGMMDDNHQKAKDAHSYVDILGKREVLYSQPSFCPGYSATLSRAREMHNIILSRVRKQKQAHHEEMKELATEYVTLKRAWRIKVKKIEKGRKKQEKRSKLRQKQTRNDENDKKADDKEGGSDAQQINHLRTSSRLTNNSTQLTQMSLLKQNADVEIEKQNELRDQENKKRRYDLELHSSSCDTFCRLKNAILPSGSSTSPYVIPDMILDKDVVRSKRFIPLPRPLLTGLERPDKLSENGMYLLEAESWKNPWSDMEKCIYIDKFLQTPKNFHRIASFLKNKSTGDVISFYYRTKKVLDYKAIIREQQLRRRGAGIKNTWNCWQLSLSAAIALGVKFPDALHSSMLQHSKFKSHQAAHSILQAANLAGQNTKYDEDEANEQTPMVFDLTDFLDDNLYSTGYNPSTRSVRCRFDDFLESSDYQPDPPTPVHSSQPSNKKAKLEKITCEATSSPLSGSRKKPATPRAVVPKLPAKKPKAKPLAIRKADEEATSSSPSVNARKDDSEAPRSPDGHQPALVPLPLPPMSSTPPMLAPFPVPLTPRTTPPTIGSSLFISTNPMSKEKRVVQKWTEQEKSDFLKFFSIYGKDWTALTNSIPSKTANQIKNYYQNYKNRLGLQDVLKRRTDRGPGSGSNTPQNHQISPTPSLNSPSHASNRGQQTHSTVQYPLSIQLPQDYPAIPPPNSQSTPASINATQHRLIQLQKELSRVQMQQIPSSTSMGQPPSTAFSINSQGSQLKLLQYTLQQQVQMLQMQMHQQSMQEKSALHVPQSYPSTSAMPRLNQPTHEQPSMYNEQIGYYDRFKDESKPHAENLPVPLSARPVLDQVRQ